MVQILHRSKHIQIFGKIQKCRITKQRRIIQYISTRCLI